VATKALRESLLDINNQQDEIAGKAAYESYLSARLLQKARLF